MKKELYVLLSAILLLFSCAEEGQYKLGKLECGIEVSDITPKTAVVSISVPDSQDNLLKSNYKRRIYLIDHPLSKTQKIDSDKLIYGNEIENSQFTKYSFSELIPNTTYYVILYNEVYYNGQNVYANEEYYYTGYSFTTAKEDETSFLTDLNYELMSYIGTYKNQICSKVILNLPSEMYFDDGISMSISESSDMTNRIESISYDKYNSERVEFVFPLIDKGIYNIELKGNFTFLGMTYRDVVIRPKTKLYYMESQDGMDGSTCEIEEYFEWNDIFIPVIQFNLPQNIVSYWNTESILYASEFKDMTNWIESTQSIYMGTNNGRQFVFKDLEKTVYYFMFNGDVYYNGYNFSKCWLPAKNILDLSNLPDKNVLYRIECKLYDYKYTSEDNNSYTVIEVSLPDNLVFASQYSTCLYASDNSDMKNSIKCSYALGNDNSNQMLYFFPVLENKEYYFELTDMVAYCYNFVSNFSWKISKSIDLSSQTK